MHCSVFVAARNACSPAMDRYPDSCSDSDPDPDPDSDPDPDPDSDPDPDPDSDSDPVASVMTFRDSIAWIISFWFQCRRLVAPVAPGTSSTSFACV